MKFCKFCGFGEDDETANFCMKCGKPFKTLMDNNSTSNESFDLSINNKSQNSVNENFDKSLSLKQNYEIIINNYIKDTPSLSTRIVKGNPYIQGAEQVEGAARYYGRNMNPNNILLYIDDSIYKGGISGILLNSDCINSHLLENNNLDAMKISDLFSVDTQNCVININKGRARLDLIMLNKEEFNFFVGLIQTLVNFNIANNISKELSEKGSFDYTNKRKNLSMPHKVYLEIQHRLVGGGADDNRIIMYPNSHRNKLENAINNICRGYSSDGIFIIFDDTIFNSAKAGIVLADNNIYIKPAFSDQFAIIPWNEVKSIGVDRKTLVINGESYKFNLDQPVMVIGNIINRVIEIQNGDVPSCTS